MQENFEEGYVKAKKKKVKWKENALSILRRGKEDTTNAKSQHQKKSCFMSFGVSKIKPLVSSKRLN
jgi:hypothetical protein